MKKLLLIVTLLSIVACGENNSSVENQKMQSELNKYLALETIETNTKQYTEDYIKAVNSAAWNSTLIKYLNPGPDTDNFFEEHSAFRTSFENYNATIKHLAVEGNEALLWINITANYATPFTLDKSAYGDEIFKGIEAKGQPVSWDETWFFDVVDGKFGGKWDFLKDNHKVLEDLKSAESP